jgi:MFS transporter, PHS family, inorganic phosphate transporter
MYGSELILIIFATLCSALSASTLKGINVLTMLAFWRFILGIGIGGDYPLSAVITSEFATVNKRGMMIASVFAMQGVGILFSALVAVTTLAAFKDLILEDKAYIDCVWRICLAFGAVPAVATVYFRMTMPESPRYTAHVLGDAEAANRDVHKAMGDEDESAENKAEGQPVDFTPSPPAQTHAPPKQRQNSFKDFCAHFSQWKNLKVLLGCSISWFVLDVAFYGLNLNQSSVLEAIGFGYSSKLVQTNTPADAFTDLWNKALGNLVIACLGTAPGYLFSVLLIEKLGRKTIQFMGFAVLTVCMLVLSIWYYEIMQISKILFITIYTVAQFFFNFGPNTTTFVVPGEVFPTRFRSTSHGISAASGKLGAIIASQLFSPLKEVIGMRALLFIFACFMATGIISTMWIPETKGKTLEELAGEEEPECAKEHYNRSVTVAV